MKTQNIPVTLKTFLHQHRVGSKVSKRKNISRQQYDLWELRSVKQLIVYNEIRTPQHK